MKVTRIEAIPFAIPYRKPLRFASGEVTTAEHVLVRVHTDDGVVGDRGRPAAAVHLRRDPGRPSLVVDRPLRARSSSGVGILEREDRPSPPGPHRRQPGGQGRLDMAIWDAIGQTLGVSVTELLGGFTDRMRVSHMVGFAPAGRDGRRGRAHARRPTASRRSR